MNKPDNLAENEDSDRGNTQNSFETGNNINDAFVVAVSGDGKVENYKNGSSTTDIAIVGSAAGSGGAGGKDSTNSADISLPNDVLERLYQRYSIKQRRAGLECFLATSVLFDLWAIFAPQQQEKTVGSLSKFFFFFKNKFFSFFCHIDTMIVHLMMFQFHFYLDEYISFMF